MSLFDSAFLKASSEAQPTFFYFHVCQVLRLKATKTLWIPHHWNNYFLGVTWRLSLDLCLTCTSKNISDSFSKTCQLRDLYRFLQIFFFGFYPIKSCSTQRQGAWKCQKLSCIIQFYVMRRRQSQGSLPIPVFVRSFDCCPETQDYTWMVLRELRIIVDNKLSTMGRGAT